MLAHTHTHPTEEGRQEQARPPLVRGGGDLQAPLLPHSAQRRTQEPPPRLQRTPPELAQRRLRRVPSAAAVRSAPPVCRGSDSVLSVCLCVVSEYVCVTRAAYGVGECMCVNLCLSLPIILCGWISGLCVPRSRHSRASLPQHVRALPRRIQHLRPIVAGAARADDLRGPQGAPLRQEAQDTGLQRLQGRERVPRRVRGAPRTHSLCRFSCFVRVCVRMCVTLSAVRPIDVPLTHSVYSSTCAKSSSPARTRSSSARTSCGATRRSAPSSAK